LLFSVCRCPLRKYHGQPGSYQLVCRLVPINALVCTIEFHLPDKSRYRTSGLRGWLNFFPGRTGSSRWGWCVGGDGERAIGPATKVFGRTSFRFFDRTKTGAIESFLGSGESLLVLDLGSIPIAPSRNPDDAVGFTGFPPPRFPLETLSFGRSWTRISVAPGVLDATIGRFLLVRLRLPAQPVDATPSNQLIRQYFP